ncbi:hypothetical protein AAG906_040700 [Vitis piasezkii]
MFSSGSYSRLFKEEPSLAHQTHPDEGTSSTQASRKMRRGRGSHSSNTMQAQLGPQAPGVEGQPHMSETLRTPKHQLKHAIFESLAKKPSTTMDDLFKIADKYSMLEDDVRAASQ